MKLRLKELREDLDKAQKELAEYIGCSQQTYSRYENGETEPSLQTLERLALYFGTSVDYIMGITDVRAPYKRSKH